ncbi:interferon-induced protein with tetratricopeptide repeats 1-like [Entelurus aequoreus]|uniref:interferon-induced protein with tetratricopeptide repeats 1-like n=1 Tax=Entelurus aequoreus TaxID=161455 RepID=UPI002B1E5A9F|nr:interferon-induced protein with tetratricopeptide repeats 1-like [Entelurus aequoreus]
MVSDTQFQLLLLSLFLIAPKNCLFTDLIFCPFLKIFLCFPILHIFSVAGTQTTPEARLEALQCHFTWKLHASRSRLFLLKDKVEDIGTVEGYNWLGHMYNLQGFVHHQLGLTPEALRYFSRAAEALRQVRNTVSEEGPWLVINYGNLAWLHHLMGEQAESQKYLSKVHTLLIDHPSPCLEELHPEICAEKAWTLMTFGKDKTPLAVEYFQRAIRMQPDVVEWHSSHVVALARTSKRYNARLQVDVLEKMDIAVKHDPDNLYLATLHLAACAAKGQRIESEACRLAKKVLRKPASSYSGIKPLLKLYRVHLSMQEALDLAEEAVERHPGHRYLKRCAAICYKKRILFYKDIPPEQNMIDRAISLHEEVISLYPQSSLRRKITLANICAKSVHGRAKADQIFEDLLEESQEAADRQMLYSSYAKYLHLTKRQSYKSIEYYMRAAAIQHPSVYRTKSIQILEKIKARNRNRMCGEIDELLANLRD